MNERQVEEAMHWAERTGAFQQSQLQDFHELIRMCLSAPPRDPLSPASPRPARAPGAPRGASALRRNIAVVRRRHGAVRESARARAQASCASGRLTVRLFARVRIQRDSVPASHIKGGRMLDSGAFGSIEKASFHGSKVAVKYVKPNSSKVQAISPAFLDVSRVLQKDLAVLTEKRAGSLANVQRGEIGGGSRLAAQASFNRQLFGCCCQVSASRGGCQRLVF